MPGAAVVDTMRVPEEHQPSPGRMECRICWHLYDPELGDPDGQIPPGTPFAALPDHWRCPNCDADKQHFLPQRE
jgi:rubredoxin